MATEIKIPSVGESVSEAVIAEWSVQEGQAVRADQPLLVLETDKANMELPAPAAGVLRRILKAAGETVLVGEVVGWLEEGEAAQAPQGEGAAAGPKIGPDPSTAAGPKIGPDPSTAAGPKIGPAARRVLAEAGVEAGQVPAGGPGGRLRKEDVLRHLGQASAAPVSVPTPASATAPAPAPAPTAGGRREERVPMSPLRKRVARRLVEAQQTAALLTTFNEVDMTAILAARKTYQEAFQKRHGVKLGFMSFFVKAAIEGLKAFPQLNAYIEGDSIVYHDYFDVGVAVSAPKGLVVPVLRDADRLGFAEVEKTLGELAERARANRITLEELQGGTFSITNGGVFGSLLSTPIVNPPQSAILGMHKTQERPVAVDGQVVIRPMMYLALTYDHRIVDGREAVSSLVRIKDCLENPLRMLLEV